eukprot:753465-Hanusia_phi.AAC.2
MPLCLLPPSPLSRFKRLSPSPPPPVHHDIVVCRLEGTETLEGLALKFGCKVMRYRDREEKKRRKGWENRKATWEKRRRDGDKWKERGQEGAGEGSRRLQKFVSETPRQVEELRRLNGIPSLATGRDPCLVDLSLSPVILLLLLYTSFLNSPRFYISPTPTTSYKNLWVPLRSPEVKVEAAKEEEEERGADEMELEITG